MKHLMYDKGFAIVGRIDLPRIKELVEESKQFGNVEVIFLKSHIPLTIFGKVKRGSEIQEDKSNHVIIEIDGKEVIEFFKKITKAFSWGIFHDENLSSDMSKEIEETLTQFDFCTGDKLAEKKIWTSTLLSIAPIFSLAIAFVNIILLIQMYNVNKMIDPFNRYTNTDYIIRILTTIFFLFSGLILYKRNKRYFS